MSSTSNAGYAPAAVAARPLPSPEPPPRLPKFGDTLEREYAVTAGEVVLYRGPELVAAERAFADPVRMTIQLPHYAAIGPHWMAKPMVLAVRQTAHLESEIARLRAELSDANLGWCEEHRGRIAAEAELAECRETVNQWTNPATRT